MIVAGIALAVVVIIVVVVVVVLTQTGGSTPASSNLSGNPAQQIVPAGVSGKTTVQQTPKRVPNNSGIPGVLAWDTQGWPGNGNSPPGALEHTHVLGPVKYAVLPPVGGPHNPVWMNAGIYTKPIPTERAVHNLEHGAVWITYDPNLPKSEVATLRAFVNKQSMISEQEQTSGQANRYMDLSPWSSNDLPAPIVLSSWGYQLRVQSPTDPRMQRFVDTFRHNSKYTPEYGAAVDGIPIKTGGRPAYDGSAKPNPPGQVPAGQGGM